MKYKYLIIGNSAGGIGAAEAIRQKNTQDSLAVISYEPSYAKPLISYYLSSKITKDKLIYRDEVFYKEKRIDYFKEKVEKIDFIKKEVILASGGKIGYDKLLLACGSKPIVPQIKGLEEFFTFTTLSEVEKIKERLTESLLSVIVLGGGLIGLKAAQALAECGKKVTVVELQDSILKGVVDKEASKRIQEHLKKNGVKIITGKTIKEVVNNKIFILNDGEEISADLLIIAVGVRPNIELVNNSQLRVNHGIVVNKRMETNIEDIYACGDVAEIYDFIRGSMRLLPLWSTAYWGGRIAALNMIGENREYTWATNHNAFDFFNYSIISAGLLEESDGDDILSRSEEEIYKKIIVSNNLIKGFIFVKEVEKAGIIFNLMREKIDVSSFKDKLIEKDFGLIYLPKELRDEKFRKN